MTRWVKTAAVDEAIAFGACVWNDSVAASYPPAHWRGEPAPDLFRGSAVFAPRILPGWGAILARNLQ
jgi:hypothetical protein